MMPAMAGMLFAGTSGFAYDEWKHGVFYPEGVRNDRMLEYYASVMNSVEINYTFRHFPAEATLAAWRDRTPAGFRFALKAPMRITHTRRLAGVKGEVETFRRRTGVMGEHLGPVIFKIPAELEYDEQLFTGFLDVLPPGMAAAMEFHNPTWEAATGLLDDRGVAVSMTDTDDAPVAEDAAPVGPFAYLRLRRTAYSDDELRRWAGRVSALLEGGRDVYCYFRHEDTGTGPRWAVRLDELIRAASPPP
jgi:uncharacterized protein YecE (DUF72 family)